MTAGVAIVNERAFELYGNFPTNLPYAVATKRFVSHQFHHACQTLR